MQKIKLGDILDVQRGTSLSGEFYSEEGNFIRLTLGNFDYPRGGFKKNDSKKDIFFTGSVSSEYILKAGDIITPLTEQVSGLLGETAFIPESNKYIQSGDIGLVIPDETKLDKKFAYYLVSSPTVRKQLDVAAQQTKIRHTSPAAIKNCETLIPSLTEQKKIGAFLYSLDEKISLNKKINSNLEEMARTIFLQKFFNRTANGKFGDIIIENPKSTISVNTAKVEGGDFPFFTSGENILRWEEKLVDGRNIFLNTGGNAGIKFYVGAAAYSTDTWSITAEGAADYLYLLLKSFSAEIGKNYFHGTGLKHLQKNFLRAREIYIPPKSELEEFNRAVEPCFTMISKNFRESAKLAELRNYLLPLLMNGQVTIKR